ncbi:hypothetical protein RchiOBHm_Chr5g0034251 [Rosa chinensis]|uniref:Uncharacterized protein n=1 Tax=Rosa chinensis TaxID=74649 RepID=A0A2P6QAW5_ROSCH|nr:hypothetical protein RchiOBHm_Chr5g0034251 [Rosa chinensis]
MGTCYLLDHEIFGGEITQQFIIFPLQILEKHEGRGAINNKLASSKLSSR